MRHILLACFVVLFFPLSADARDKEPLTVLAAASLSDAMAAVISLWQTRTGDGVRLSLAASSTLARQIEAGAPADIVLSANMEWMDYLEKRMLIRPQTRCTLLGNRLVLIAPADGVQNDFADDETPDIAALLTPDARLVLGDPQHVPAGIYAREALTALGQWTKVESRLAMADNVRAALALVARGEAALGIVYETDIRGMKTVRRVWRIPAMVRSPIRYTVAVVASSRHDRAQAFLAFLISDDAQALFQGYGFDIDPQSGDSC